MIPVWKSAGSKRIHKISWSFKLLQATFVFVNPQKDKEALIRERDDAKETLQQALIAHRARVNQVRGRSWNMEDDESIQMAAANESLSKTAELENKKKILMENRELDQVDISCRFFRKNILWITNSRYQTTCNYHDCYRRNAVLDSFLQSISSFFWLSTFCHIPDVRSSGRHRTRHPTGILEWIHQEKCELYFISMRWEVEFCRMEPSRRRVE